MKRRTFLKTGTLFLSGAALTAANGLFPRGVLARPLTGSNFSIDVVTSHPDEAARRIVAILRNTVAAQRNIQVSETRLAGSFVGDIAYVNGSRLVDFRRDDDAFSRELAGVRRALSLPRAIENPTLVRFFTRQESSRATQAQVFVGDVLVERLSLDHDLSEHRVHGLKGHVDLSIEDRAVRISGASCKHKTCVKMGAIRQPGQPLVCIPAGVHVSLNGTDNFGVDSVTF